MTCKGCGYPLREGAPHCLECWGHAADMREGDEPEPDEDEDKA